MGDVQGTELQDTGGGQSLGLSGATEDRARASGTDHLEKLASGQLKH